MICCGVHLFWFLFWIICASCTWISVFFFGLGMSSTIMLLNTFFTISTLFSPSGTPAAAAKLFQSCPTLCDLIDDIPPGSLVPGILQARTLEWVAISFSNAWKWKVKVRSLSRVWLLATAWTVALQAPPSMGFFRQEYWSGVPFPSPITGILIYLMLHKDPLNCFLFVCFSFGALIDWFPLFYLADHLRVLYHLVCCSFHIVYFSFQLLYSAALFCIF